jgi:acetyl esterase/lipase
VLGPAPAPGLERLLSNETQVTRETPPTFIVASTDDAAVPVENSLAFYQAARNAGVPVELHVFESGRHGFGLGGDDPSLSSWPRQAELWLRHRKLLGPDKVTK